MCCLLFWLKVTYFLIHAPVAKSGVWGDKHGFISEKTARTIDQIGINPDDWLDELKGFKSIGFCAVGTAEQLKELSTKKSSGKIFHVSLNGVSLKDETNKTKRKWTIRIKLKPTL